MATTSPRRELTLALTAIALMSACSARMTRVTRVLNPYESALRLTVQPKTASPRIDELLDVHLTLTNVSAHPIESACLGVSRSVHFTTVPLAPRDGRQPIAGTATTVDHPYCVRPLVLGPGDTVEWREEVRVADIGAGDAELSMAVQVVYGRDCDNYGCYETMLSASPVRLSLRERAAQQ